MTNSWKVNWSNFALGDLKVFHVSAPILVNLWKRFPLFSLHSSINIIRVLIIQLFPSFCLVWEPKTLFVSTYCSPVLMAFISCLLYFEVLCFQVSTERENAVISFWWIILVWSSLGVLVFLWTMHILPLRKHKRKQNLPYFWLSDFLGLQESSKQFLSMYQSAPYYF